LLSLIPSGSFSSSALLSSPPSFFPLVPIIATLGALVKVYIISMKEYTTVLACMDFFQPLFREDRLSSSHHRQTLLFGFLQVACL
jgi:hypothetical protein